MTRDDILDMAIKELRAGQDPFNVTGFVYRVDMTPADALQLSQDLAVGARLVQHALANPGSLLADSARALGLEGIA